MRKSPSSFLQKCNALDSLVALLAGLKLYSYKRDHMHENDVWIEYCHKH